jgi:GNAT superfamily N-acetyltransferase
MGEPRFRAYEPADRDACLALFDANCPAAFAPNERDEYAEFLDEGHAGYEVCVDDGGAVVGAFGLVRDGDELALRWILIAPDAQGRGLGGVMMRRAVEMARGAGVERVRISAPPYIGFSRPRTSTRPRTRCSSPCGPRFRPFPWRRSTKGWKRWWDVGWR